VLNTTVLARCTLCLRATFDQHTVGQPCLMPQPDSSRCKGSFSTIAALGRARYASGDLVTPGENYVVTAGVAPFTGRGEPTPARRPIAWLTEPNALSHRLMTRKLSFHQPHARDDWTVTPLYKD